MSSTSIFYSYPKKKYLNSLASYDIFLHQGLFVLIAVIQQMRYKCYSTLPGVQDFSWTKPTYNIPFDSLECYDICQSSSDCIGGWHYFLTWSLFRPDHLPLQSTKYKTYIWPTLKKIHSKACVLLGTLFGFLVSCASLVVETNMDNLNQSVWHSEILLNYK